MTEFEAFKNMLTSMMTYVGITEESEKKTYDEATIENVRKMLDAMSEPLARAVNKAFKDTFRDDYRKLLTITLRAITESLQGLKGE